MTISLDENLAEAVREAAEADALNLSAWISDAIRRRLASRGLRQVVAEWEAQHGFLTEEELSAARRRLEA